jgi:predicted transcriptional regulator
MIMTPRDGYKAKSFWLDDETAKMLEEIAMAQDRNQSQVVRRLVRREHAAIFNGGSDKKYEIAETSHIIRD